MSGIAAPGTGARVPSHRNPGDDGTTGAAPRPRTGDSAVRNGTPRNGTPRNGIPRKGTPRNGIPRKGIPCRGGLLPAAGRQGGGMAAGPALLAW
ncbi:hypothetical protein AB0H82_35865 [Streptomyces sp. NPDC050732]|uniref:hypothetical protein n=1 Tax=Streptomyces sp. NPDC050732 TaxID=3154632 RepID=UPI003440FFF1